MKPLRNDVFIAIISILVLWLALALACGDDDDDDEDDKTEYEENGCCYIKVNDDTCAQLIGHSSAYCSCDESCCEETAQTLGSSQWIFDEQQCGQTVPDWCEQLSGEPGCIFEEGTSLQACEDLVAFVYDNCNYDILEMDREDVLWNCVTKIPHYDWDTAIICMQNLSECSEFLNCINS